MKRISLKIKLLIFLIIFAGFITFIDKDFSLLRNVILGTTIAGIFDFILHYLRRKSFIFKESGFITGAIVGYVLSNDISWWIFLVVCIVAILSKYIIKYKHKNIFNPAAFGMFISLVLFKQYTQWAGAYLFYVLVPIGLYFSWKIKKISIVATYYITYLSLFFIQSLFNKGGDFLNILSYTNYFFIFIMLIEPKTSPISKLGKYIFGIGVASTVFLLYFFSYSYDAELTALLMFNMLVPILNKINRRTIL